MNDDNNKNDDLDFRNYCSKHNDVYYKLVLASLSCPVGKLHWLVQVSDRGRPGGLLFHMFERSGHPGMNSMNI